MATIRRRNDSYHVQIRRKGHKTLTRSFNTQAAAKRWATATEAALDAGQEADYSLARKTTVSSLLDRYSREVLPTKRSQQAVRSHISTLTRKLGRYSLAALTAQMIAAYRNERLLEVGPQSVKHELGILRRVLNVAISEWGYTLPRGNPVAHVRAPTLPSGRTRRLAPAETAELHAALERTPQVQLIVELALETAMRRGEICNLRWDDINWTVPCITLHKTKTDEPRAVPLSQRALTLLKALQSEQRAHDTIFTIKPDSITQAFRRACSRAGIDNLTFHDLRHEATTRLFEKGLNVMEASVVTGHRDPRMLRRYTHLLHRDIAMKLG